MRRRLGPLERPAVETYRRVFIDLDAFVSAIRSRVPAPARILEIGCGEGALAERLALAYPDAAIDAIDICQTPGRLCTIKEPRLRFRQMAASALRADEPGGYPLVVICDVIHHVPLDEREGLLKDVAALVAPGGMLICKEWVRQTTLAYLAGYWADRLITGDDVHYLSEAELKEAARRASADLAIRDQFRVPPWNCNLAVVMTRAER